MALTRNEFQHGLRRDDGVEMWCTKHSLPTAEEAVETATECWPAGDIILRSRYASPWVTLTSLDRGY